MPREIEIHLRRHYIAQAAARRPRLPGNLKQLGAVGPVVKPIAPNSQQAVVKVGITKGSTTQQHLAYLQKEKGHDQHNAPLFGPAVAQRERFVQQAQQDPHQFRIIVSMPSHTHLDRTRSIELFMAQVERDLGRPLDWLAAHHDDTDHPHTHLVVRGRDRDGKDLYMTKDYMTYGLRARMAQLLTWMLGPQRQQQAQQESQRLAFNGIPQGLDDPDTRGRIAQTSAAMGPDDDRPPGYVVDQQRSPQPRVPYLDDATRQAKQEIQERWANVQQAYQQADHGATRDHGASLGEMPRTERQENLVARLATLQQAIRAQQQRQQRDQGRGW
jgi:hypothetical protein